MSDSIKACDQVESNNNAELLLLNSDKSNMEITNKQGWALLMNKSKLIAHICDQLLKDLTILTEAARATAEAATHEESKPENQYDTRALEASYLAGAQSKRIVDIEQMLMVFKHLVPHSFQATEAISTTALVEAQLNDKTLFFFISPKGGGLSVEFEGRHVQIITPASPLGETLIGLKAGQSAVIEKGDRVLEYDIVSVQ